MKKKTTAGVQNQPVKRRVIAVVQHKGGSSKTTTSVNLATMIAQLRPNLRVAIADADARGDYFAYGWLDASLETKVTVQKVALDASGEGRGLKGELEAIEADIIILDLPPAVAAIALRAVMYADLMLIPLSESGLDFKGAEHAMEYCLDALAMAPHKVVMLIPSNVDPETTQYKEMEKTLPLLGRVSKTFIRHRTVYKQLTDTGVGINRYRPYSAACYEVKRLANEVLDILEKEMQ